MAGTAFRRREAVGFALGRYDPYFGQIFVLLRVDMFHDTGNTASVRRDLRVTDQPDLHKVINGDISWQMHLLIESECVLKGILMAVRPNNSDRLNEPRNRKNIAKKRRLSKERLSQRQSERDVRLGL